MIKPKSKKVCRVCFANFPTIAELVAHVENHENGVNNYYECLTCDQKIFFLSEKSVIQVFFIFFQYCLFCNFSS